VSVDAGPTTPVPAVAFAARLLAWFERDGRRDLPWQRDPTPYRAWVSEIMLQQTQVGTVIPYFEAFMRRFPDAASLAAAPLDEVLHLWSGLGYYARARHLHRAARVIVARHGGEFPRTLEDVMSLPGVGRSTAGAILALSRGERHPILDGNVKRVLTRHFGVEGYPGEPRVEQQLWTLAESCTPRERAAEYTQAIMDLGATVCTRAKPACLLCPVASDCIARRDGRQAELPSPRPKARRPQREVWVVIAIRAGGELLLERRPPHGVWGGLWGLPEFPTRAHATQWSHERLTGAQPAVAGEPLRHAFSHFELEIKPLVVRCTDATSGLREDDRYLWYDTRDPPRLGLPKPVATLIAVAAGGGEKR
jgi:A/G-specific adenine glycosylase